MFEVLNSLTEWLREALGSPWLWLIVFLLAGLDALLPFMPSETTVITVAVALGRDVPSLALLAVLASAGALAGDCLGHGFGRAGGRHAISWLGRGKRRSESYAWVREKLYRHAATVIIAGRYIPGGRVAVGLTTGSMRYPVKRFVALDAIGTTIWAIYCAGIGYLGWQSFSGQPAKALLLAFGVGLGVLVAIEGGGRFLRHRQRRRQREVLHV